MFKSAIKNLTHDRGKSTISLKQHN